MKIKILTATIVVLLLVGINQAQTYETWHLEKRCLTQPETPPDDWTYSGTILTNSEQGIHGYNANWETRRILAYKPNNVQLSPPISPDGRTWVTLQGDSWCTGSCSATTRILNSMTIHDLSASIPQNYNLDWEFVTGDRWQESVEGRGIPILRWFSPTQFIYVKDLDGLYGGSSGVPVLFDTVTQEIQLYDEANLPPQLEHFHRISPDGRLEVRTEYDEDYNAYFNLIDIQTNTVITTLPENLYPLHYSVLEAWSPDSEFFLVTTHLDNMTNVVLVNREGQILNSVARLEDTWFPIDVDWSPNSRYLTIFNYNSFGPGPERPVSLLVDYQDKDVYDLCLPLDIEWRTAWSYDSSQLALQTSDSSDNTGNITIFEPATWDWYIAEENSDTFLVGWQFPEE